MELFNLDDNMYRILAYPYYMKSLLSSFLSYSYSVESDKEINRFLEKIRKEKYDAYIFAYRDEKLFNQKEFIEVMYYEGSLIILDELIKRGYRPASIKNKTLREGFILDPEAFYLAIDVVIEYLLNKIFSKEESLYHRGEVLKKLFDFSIGKSKKILSSRLSENLIPFTSIEFYIMKTLGVSPKIILFDIENCDKFIELSNSGSNEKLIVVTKYSLDNIIDRCSNEILAHVIRDIESIGINYFIVDTSLNCHIFAPLIFSTSLSVYYLK